MWPLWFTLEQVGSGRNLSQVLFIYFFRLTLMYPRFYIELGIELRSLYIIGNSAN